MSNLVVELLLRAKDLMSDKVRAGADAVKAWHSQAMRAAQGTKEFGDQAQDAEQRTGKFGDSLKSGARQIGAYIAAFAGLHTIKQGLQAILNTGGQFEALNQQLRAVMGSVEGGERAFAWIKQFSKDTPYQLDQVSEAFVKLKAFGLDPMDGTMQAIVDQSAKLGGSQETLNGIILAVGQAWAKQKLQGEEILQLVERGVPVWDLLSEATGRSTIELQKMSEAGQLGRREIALLIDAIGQSSQGAAADTMTTWRGLVSNLKDQWSEFLDSIARAGVLDYFKQQIIDAGAALKRFAEDGTLKRWAQNISDAITGTAQAIKQGVAFIAEYSGALLSMAKAFAAIKAAEAAGAVIKFGASLAGTIAALTGFGSAAATAAGKAGELGTAIRRIPTSVKIGIAVLGFELAVKAGKVLGETVARLTQDQDALRAAQEHYNAAAFDGIVAGQNLVAENARYADTVIQTAATVARMSDTERAAYRTRLEGLQEYERGQLRIALNEELLGAETKQRQAEITQSFAAIRAGFAVLDEGAAFAAKALRNNLTPAAQELVDQFAALAHKGGEAKSALAEVFQGFDPASTASIQTYGAMLGKLAGDGQLAADVIRNQLAQSLKDLSGADLVNFQVTTEAALGGAADKAAELAMMLDGSLAAALARLGVDAHELETGITTAGQSVLDTFTAIATNAQANSQQIGAAFEQALGKLNKQEELDALRVSLKRAFDDGGLSAADYQRRLEDLDRKLLGLKDTAEDKVAQAFKHLGIESKKSLESAAMAALAAFETIKNSGTAAPEDIAAAFLAYATAAIEANNGVISSQLAAQAASLGLLEVLKSLKGIQQEVAGLKPGGLLSDVERDLAAADAAWQKYWKQIRDGFYGMSDAVGAAYDEILDRTVRMRGGFVDFFRLLEKETNQLTAAYNDQLGMFDQLMARVESGTMSARELDIAAQSAAGSFNLMGSERLEQLRGALDDALRKLEELEASSQRTLDSLQDRLDRLRGDELSIQRRATEREREEIERQLSEARKYGSRDAVTDLEQALALLDQINRAEITRIREQQAQRQQPQRQTIEDRRATTTTINVHGVTEPEAVARLIEPKLRSIWARKA